MNANNNSWNQRGYEAVIGLEIHAQLKTKSKLFSSDSTEFQAGDNENTSPVSVGMPGTLPVFNKEALVLAIRAGLALGCQIKQKSIFVRKNYFYPDLPKGYQISQFEDPICLNGKVKFEVEGEEKEVRIERAHIEEDAGKSTHFGGYSLINYNRSGVPLLEIVSAPDMRSPQEAAEYSRTVRRILKYVEVCDGNLEEGSLRCDCNVSVRKQGIKELGVKVEIKNLNSFRFIEKAVEFEIERQIEVLERGEIIRQETRQWDTDKNRTHALRSKEESQDYRYFPDPDLLPVRVMASLIKEIQDQLPELPDERKKRFIQNYGLSFHDASFVTEEKELAEYFEMVAKESSQAKLAANWIMTDLIYELKKNSLTIKESKIKASDLGKMLMLIAEGKLSSKMAKEVFSDMWEKGLTAEAIIKQKNLIQISDVTLLEKYIDEILAQNQQLVQEYKSGKTKVLGFFIGLLMKKTKGQAHPETLNELLLRSLTRENKE